MDETTSLSLLLGSTATIALIHALAPDHWIPLAGMARAREWSRGKTVVMTLVCGLGHVGSSMLLGLIGLAVGIGLNHLVSIESQRMTMAGWLLIGFGIAYAVWGLKHALGGHHHHGKSHPRSLAVWTLILLFTLGPCEPLIPLLFVAYAKGMSTVLLVAAVFSAITLVLMVVQVALAREGLKLVRAAGFEHWSHAVAGVVIAFVGVLVMALGL